MSDNIIIITSFYHFKILENYEELKDVLLSFCKAHNLKGTILLAREGINSTISGTRNDIDEFYSYIINDLNIPVTNFKESIADFKPFLKMKVRIKKEIVAMGVYDLDVDKFRGEYISSKDWDELIKQQDVVLIDTRNRYEVKLGTFLNAVNPNTKFFRQFPDWLEENRQILENKKIAMFCTGGVRCEKSTSYLKSQGFSDVYHLEGGILQYLEDTNNESRLWHGDCFVFDDRVAVDDNLLPSQNLTCWNCDAKMTTDDIRDTASHKRVICIKCSDNGLRSLDKSENNV